MEVTFKEEERSVIHVKIVPFVLMRINVCDYPVYLVCKFSEGVLRMNV